MTDRIFCHFLSSFALLPHWQPGKSKLKKKNEEKIPGDTIILQMCT